MARLVNVRLVLEVYAARYPCRSLYVQLEDDSIPQNSGYYTVAGGQVSREQVAGKQYMPYTVASLTRLLLAGEHPYMSLMLN